MRSLFAIADRSIPCWQIDFAIDDRSDWQVSKPKRTIMTYDDAPPCFLTRTDEHSSASPSTSGNHQSARWHQSTTNIWQSSE